MPYYPQIKLLQLHIPKTGGTSIENTIRQTLCVPLFDWKQSEENYKSPGSRKEWQTYNIYGYYETAGDITPLQHLTYRQILQGGHISKDMINWILVSVRNPLSRLVSCYHWQRGYPGRQNNMTFREFVHWVKETKSNLPGAKPIDHRCYQHLLQQSEFLGDLDPKTTKLHIIKFETLSEDFERFFNSQVRAVYPKFKSSRLRNDNITDKSNGLPDWKTNYMLEDGKTLDKELIDLVYNLYEQDFKLFGYTKDI